MTSLLSAFRIKAMKEYAGPRSRSQQVRPPALGSVMRFTGLFSYVFALLPNVPYLAAASALKPRCSGSGVVTVVTGANAGFRVSTAGKYNAGLSIGSYLYSTIARERSSSWEQHRRQRSDANYGQLPGHGFRYASVRWRDTRHRCRGEHPHSKNVCDRLKLSYDAVYDSRCAG